MRSVAGPNMQMRAASRKREELVYASFHANNRIMKEKKRRKITLDAGLITPLGTWTQCPLGLGRKETFRLCFLCPQYKA